MKKRANGEGSYRRLPSGNWIGQLMDGYTPEGKRNVINVTAPTKAEAQQKIRQYLIDKEKGVLLLDKEMSFSKWANTWYADYEGQVQSSTYANYKYTLKTLTDNFGERPISSIKQMDINRFLAELNKKGFSASKIGKCKSMLIQIFAAAEDNELILKNPALRARCIRDTNQFCIEKKDAFSKEEAELLFSILPSDRIGNSIRTMLVSGVRVQELLAFTKEDIAVDGSRISVNKAVKMVDGIPQLGPPKTKRGAREIPIPSEYRRYVVELRNSGSGAFIWTSPRTESLLYGVGSFRKIYYKAIGSVPGVRRLPPHCCRHTYITRLEEKGVPMEMISRLAGHSNISTTDGYTHTSFETLSNMVERLNDK